MFDNNIELNDVRHSEPLQTPTLHART